MTGDRDFSGPGDDPARNGTGLFVSFGQGLSRVGLEGVMRFIRETYVHLESFDLWFPHPASAEMCRMAEKELKLDGKVRYETFPRRGNLVSASIPAAMHLASEDGRLVRGHKVVLCPASAGMSFALVDFVY